MNDLANKIRALAQASRNAELLEALADCAALLDGPQRYEVRYYGDGSSAVEQCYDATAVRALLKQIKAALGKQK